jgi:hypothetical protein
MNILQFHREFKIAFDKTDSSAYPEFLDGEIDYYLNEAQDQFIKQRYGLNNIYRAGYEQMQKRTDDLKELVISRYTSLSTVAHYPNVYRADLSDLYTDEAHTTSATESYMLFIKALQQTCKDGCCNWGDIKLVQQDDISRVLSDPFNRPTISRPVMIFEDGDIFVWTEEGASIENFLVTFLKRPAQMNKGTYGTSPTVVQCELGEYTHKEIVQMAVKIALENIESPRQQTQEATNIQRME